MAIKRMYLGADRGARKPPPDRYCVTKGSAWHRPLPGAIRIALDGIEQHDCVVEYCVSGGWARVHVMVNGKPVPNMLKTDWRNRMVHAAVTVWWADEPVPAAVIRATVPASLCKNEQPACGANGECIEPGCTAEAGEVCRHG